MKSFIIQPFKGQMDKTITVKYTDAGLLCAIEWHNVTTVDDLTYSRQFAALKLNNFYTTMQTHKHHAVFREVPADLSFAAFWNLYAYKVGNKARCEKLWKLLDSTDRIACLASLLRYKRYMLAHPNQELAYPETYLNQRRWENEY